MFTVPPPKKNLLLSTGMRNKITVGAITDYCKTLIEIERNIRKKKQH